MERYTSLARNVTHLQPALSVDNTDLNCVLTCLTKQGVPRPMTQTSPGYSPPLINLLEPELFFKF